MASASSEKVKQSIATITDVFVLGVTSGKFFRMSAAM